MRSLVIVISVASFFSCTCPDKSVTYESLVQFPEPLHSHLKKIVAENMLYNGIMWEEPKIATSVVYLYKQASTQDLIKISKSEHAILRTLANEILMTKPGVNHFSFLKNHLFDTANSLVADHEMGMWFTNSSDWILQQSDQDTSITTRQKTELTHLLITEHPYLRAAYTALFHLPTQEKYYPLIRKMTEVKRDKVDESQFALYALSRFHYQKDVSYIKEKLMSGDVSPYTAPIFFLMMDNPDTAYFSSLRKFFYRTKFSNCRPEISYYFSDCFRLMANAVAAYGTPQAAELLSQMLTDARFGECQADERIDAAFAIINHPCKAFEILVPQAMKMIRENYPELDNLVKIRKEAAMRKPVPPPGEFYHVEAPGWW